MDLKRLNLIRTHATRFRNCENNLEGTKGESDG